MDEWNTKILGQIFMRIKRFATTKKNWTKTQMILFRRKTRKCLLCNMRKKRAIFFINRLSFGIWHRNHTMIIKSPSSTVASHLFVTWICEWKRDTKHTDTHVRNNFHVYDYRCSFICESRSLKVVIHHLMRNQVITRHIKNTHDHCIQIGFFLTSHLIDDSRLCFYFSFFLFSFLDFCFHFYIANVEVCLQQNTLLFI